jgi:hypothetical protein
MTWPYMKVIYHKQGNMYFGGSNMKCFNKENDGALEFLRMSNGL